MVNWLKWFIHQLLNCFAYTSDSLSKIKYVVCEFFVHLVWIVIITVHAFVAQIRIKCLKKIKHYIESEVGPTQASIDV